jgi:predicted DNA-binding ArsR family transcriptional regulator
LFIKGGSLNDAQSLLIQLSENVQAGRQIRFTNLPEIVTLETILKNYIKEAIEKVKRLMSSCHTRVHRHDVTGASCNTKGYFVCLRRDRGPVNIKTPLPDTFTQ